MLQCFPVGSLATYKEAPSYKEMIKIYPLVRPGGLYTPPDCISRGRVAIIIPFRDREEHLRVLLHNLHPMLQRQQLDYGIYVIEQVRQLPVWRLCPYYHKLFCLSGLIGLVFLSKFYRCLLALNRHKKKILF